MIVTKTPFRISFIGGGTDLRSFYKDKLGKVITCTIDKYIYVIVKPKLGIVEHKFRINWSKVEFVNKLEDIEHPIVRETLKYFKVKGPLEITTFSDVPAETGLASSSAFAVGLVKAISILKNKKLSKHDVANIAHHIEVNVLKRNMGKQDHFACVYGGFNEFNFYSNEKVVRKKLKISTEMKKLLNSKLSLHYTSIKRNASTILKKQSILNNIQKKNLEELINMLPKFRNSLLDKNKLKNLGNLLDDSFSFKKKINNNVSNSMLEKIYTRSKKLNVVGGKILGAGNGGFFLFFSNNKIKKNLNNKIGNLKLMNFKFEENGVRTIKIIDQ
jgi:D-glycero-alpha-D-manno-heptose-7-phosphate kinase